MCLYEHMYHCPSSWSRYNSWQGVLSASCTIHELALHKNEALLSKEVCFTHNKNSFCCPRNWGEKNNNTRLPDFLIGANTAEVKSLFAKKEKGKKKEKKKASGDWGGEPCPTRSPIKFSWLFQCKPDMNFLSGYWQARSINMCLELWVVECLSERKKKKTRIHIHVPLSVNSWKYSLPIGLVWREKNPNFAAVCLNRKECFLSSYVVK